MVKITFLDKEMDDIETTIVKMPIEKAIELIDKAERIAVGADRLRCEKTGYIAIDFQEEEIDVQVEF